MRKSNLYKIFRIAVIVTLCLFSITSANATDKVSANRVDIDLSRMSSTMVYTMVYKMVTEPEKFVGKTIKMKGIFSSYVDEETNRRFFGCVIKDALACCSQGLAFELAKPRKYPSEYPSEGASITIIGTFEFEKEEDGIGFPIIKDAILFR
jgi:hypothetical protein